MVNGDNAETSILAPQAWQDSRFSGDISMGEGLIHERPGYKARRPDLAAHTHHSGFPADAGCATLGRVTGNPDPLDYLTDVPPLRPPRLWETDDGRRVAWDEFGDPAGRPLIYAHGWPSSRLQARLLHHLARERGMRVLALDRPGIGQSTYQPGRTLESWPSLVAAFADAQGIGRFAQLGVSGGGPYVLACAAMLPQRVTASAVLCGAVPVTWQNRRGLHAAYRMLMPWRRLPRWLISPPLHVAACLATCDPDHPPMSWVLRVLPQADRRLLLDNPGVVRVLAESFREGVRQGGRGVMADADIYFHAWKIPLEKAIRPIRYWHGGRDGNISADMVREFVARIPGARLDVDPAEGHFSLAIHRARDAMDHLAAT
jgi:pimeloyl-ACP methyl ester carboxylesterase